MKELLKTIKAKKDDAEEAEALSFSDLEPLHAFQWLLNEAELLVLTSLTEELVSSVTAPKGSTKPPKGASNIRGVCDRSFHCWHLLVAPIGGIRLLYIILQLGLFGPYPR